MDTSKISTAFTIAEAARFSGVSPQVIKAAIQRDYLKTLRLGSRQIILVEDLEHWLVTAANQAREAGPAEAVFSPVERQTACSLLTTMEASKYLGLGVSTLERHRCHGTGPQFIRLGNGRSIRYRQADLDRWCRTSRSTCDVG